MRRHVFPQACRDYATTCFISLSAAIQSSAVARNLRICNRTEGEDRVKTQQQRARADQPPKKPRTATYLDVTPKLLRYAVKVHGGRGHHDLGGRGDVGRVQHANELVHLWQRGRQTSRIGGNSGKRVGSRARTITRLDSEFRPKDKI